MSITRGMNTKVTSNQTNSPLSLNVSISKENVLSAVAPLSGNLSFASLLAPQKDREKDREKDESMEAGKLCRQTNSKEVKLAEESEKKIDPQKESASNHLAEQNNFAWPLKTLESTPSVAQSFLPQLNTAANWQEVAKQMLRQVRVMQIGGQTQLELEISTKKISQLNLSLRLDKGRVNACFAALNQQSLEILQQAKPQLEKVMSERGIEFQIEQMSLLQQEQRFHKNDSSAESIAPLKNESRRIPNKSVASVSRATSANYVA